MKAADEFLARRRAAVKFLDGAGAWMCRACRNRISMRMVEGRPALPNQRRAQECTHVGERAAS